jgi:radical SAM protein with 4Fe4S-binding SPASM domain
MKKSIGWGLGRCNMGCQHCYAASGNACPQYAFQRLKKIADKICPNADSINYGTGEFVFNLCAFMLARYISETYPYVAQSVTTNGSTVMIIKELWGAQALKDTFHDIDFSIDYPNPGQHNAFRRHPYAWDWVIKGLEICQNEGIEFSVVTCATGLTTDDDLLGLLDIARKYGASFRINWYRPTGRGKSEKRLNLDPARVWKILKLLSENSRIEALSDPLFDGVLGTGYNKYDGCACGENSCRIQTNLSVTPCVFLGGKEWSGGAINRRSLDQIFTSRTFQKFRSRNPKFCQGCQFWEKCRGGCASRAILYRGGLNEPDGFCPIVNNIPLEDISDIRMKFLGGKEKKVHDGYLCTLIVKS